MLTIKSVRIIAVYWLYLLFRNEEKNTLKIDNNNDALEGSKIVFYICTFPFFAINVLSVIIELA